MPLRPALHKHTALHPHCGTVTVNNYGTDQHRDRERRVTALTECTCTYGTMTAPPSISEPCRRWPSSEAELLRGVARRPIGNRRTQLPLAHSTTLLECGTRDQPDHSSVSELSPRLRHQQYSNTFSATSSLIKELEIISMQPKVAVL